LPKAKNPGSAPLHNFHQRSNCYWVCVVVVEVAGTAATAGVAVVVLVVVDGVDEQPVSVTRAAVAMHAIMNFVISIIVIWFVNLQACRYAIGWSYAMGCNPTVIQRGVATALRHGRRQGWEMSAISNDYGIALSILPQ
jgi:hypothetical protein